MFLVLAFLIVLLFLALASSTNLLFFVAAALLVLWLAEFTIGRHETTRRHHFYRW